MESGKSGSASVTKAHKGDADDLVLLAYSIPVAGLCVMAESKERSIQIPSTRETPLSYLFRDGTPPVSLKQLLSFDPNKHNNLMSDQNNTSSQRVVPVHFVITDSELQHSSQNEGEIHPSRSHKESRKSSLRAEMIFPSGEPEDSEKETCRYQVDIPQEDPVYWLTFFLAQNNRCRELSTEEIGSGSRVRDPPSTAEEALTALYDDALS